ncbi:MAG: hypothetical protein NVS1B11_02820 [Terriglobales bacterium]
MNLLVNAKEHSAGVNIRLGSQEIKSSNVSVARDASYCRFGFSAKGSVSCVQLVACAFARTAAVAEDIES